MTEQLWFPFIEYCEKSQKKEDAVIMFHLPGMTKKALVDQARLDGVSVTGLLNGLITDYISGRLESIKQVSQPKKTGRGNVDLVQLEKTKEILRMRHSEGVRAIDIAEWVGCSQARAVRLIDLLSEYSEYNHNFLVWEDFEHKPTKYFIYKDGG